ncbi:hypothetical protein BSL78_27684 [Apostichopus japonicus]|uniref:Uncharacterized protein n=1 Tax=Stichopus japonicus TaxID=307972 RepID=A0A2G8JIC2_STIJA|nr:hypothetical protein BSL78_27684 [Apostichopus japonicus]
MLAQEVVFDIPKGRYKTVARISHKIICEFYASHHLVWILSEGASSAASPINVKETLKSINPLDLQYVYRFACGLNKSAADIIIKYLQKTKEGRQFAMLCMLEQEEKSDQFQQSVKDLVSSGILIRSCDAKLLQRSTIQVLEVASAKQGSFSYYGLSTTVLYTNWIGRAAPSVKQPEVTQRPCWDIQNITARTYSAYVAMSVGGREGDAKRGQGREVNVAETILIDQGSEVEHLNP